MFHTYQTSGKPLRALWPDVEDFTDLCNETTAKHWTICTRLTLWGSGCRRFVLTLVGYDSPFGRTLVHSQIFEDSLPYPPRGSERVRLRTLHQQQQQQLSHGHLGRSEPHTIFSLQFKHGFHHHTAIHCIDLGIISALPPTNFTLTEPRSLCGQLTWPLIGQKIQIPTSTITLKAVIVVVRTLCSAQGIT